jgi:hypothetical protein
MAAGRMRCYSRNVGEGVFSEDSLALPDKHPRLHRRFIALWQSLRGSASSPKKGGGYVMRRAALLLTTMALAIVLASGVAQAILNGQPDQKPPPLRGLGHRRGLRL